MASPYSQSYDFGDVLTSVTADYFSELGDNVSNNNGLLTFLNKKGRVETFDGGHEMWHPIAYQEMSTYKRYSGAETLTLAADQHLTIAAYAIKQVALTIQINGLEELQVSGKNQLRDLMAERMDNAIRTFKNGFSTDTYSSGTADNSKQIGGLQLLAADVATSGVVGGIDRATWSFWQNYSFDPVNDGGAAFTSANAVDYMGRVWDQITRNQDGPDFGVADSNYWRAYHQALLPLQRINSTDGDINVGTGFPTLDFMGNPIIRDGGRGGSCPTNHLYLLNSNYLRLRPHSKRNMTQIGGRRQSINQDASVSIMGWAGNMTMNCAFMQGVIHG